ncbi:hypothetical protein EVAR_78789_1 [Eumeta japonica]|uniref:Uncharacterized protein n=1 Tax=Eumeta variegata TaxID=151549 RepID=A0A4C1T4Y1_EUMVA|nr:hypothetical protein EVAR_78789_1 [Eumeta japonica]
MSLEDPRESDSRRMLVLVWFSTAVFVASISHLVTKIGITCETMYTLTPNDPQTSPELNSAVCFLIYAASLCALSKKDGGIRPITVDYSMPQPPAKQCTCNEIGSKATLERLLEEVPDTTNKARLRVALTLEFEAWLHALSSPNFGTLVDDNSLSVAVTLRLGYNVCERTTLMHMWPNRRG